MQGRCRRGRRPPRTSDAAAAAELAGAGGWPDERREGSPAWAIVDQVVAAYPRLDFKRGFTELIEDQAARKPNLNC